MEHVFATGPDFSHIAIYLSLDPPTVRKLRRGFERINEYVPRTAREDHVLLLFDKYNIARPDRELALRCVGAG
jgi:hypothetical protein